MGEVAYYEDLDSAESNNSNASSSYYRDVRGDDEFGSVISVFGEEFVNGGSLDSSLGEGGGGSGSYDAGYSEAKKKAEAEVAAGVFEEGNQGLLLDVSSSHDGGGSGSSSIEGVTATATRDDDDDDNNNSTAEEATATAALAVGSAVDDALKHLEEDLDLVRFSHSSSLFLAS